MLCLNFSITIRAFKTSLLVRNLDGHYSMMNGQDQWEIAAAFAVKFAPSVVIHQSEKDCSDSG